MIKGALTSVILMFVFIPIPIVHFFAVPLSPFIGGFIGGAIAKAEKENFEVELPWQNLKVVLDNGQQLPEWIIYDPKTGKVTATPPENVQSIDLKVIVENPNGELSVKDIKLDFVNENAQETKNIIENETKFVSLSSQLSKEYSDWDDYVSQLIDRL